MRYRKINIQIYKKWYPKLYTKYVDDVFANFEGNDNVMKFLDILNGQHKNLEFSVKWAKGTLPFLDVEISMGKKIETWVHRKSTNTGVILNYKSIAHDLVKLDWSNVY